MMCVGGRAKNEMTRGQYSLRTGYTSVSTSRASGKNCGGGRADLVLPGSRMIRRDRENRHKPRGSQKKPELRSHNAKRSEVSLCPRV